MDIKVLTGSLRRAFATSSTATSFAAKAATLTKPSGDGVIELAPLGQPVESALLVYPFGEGDEDTTFSLRLLAWHVADGTWFASTLLELVCTLSAYVGVAGGAVTATERFADTLAAVTDSGNEGVDYLINSPANDTPAHALILLKGTALPELSVDLTGATAGNALVGGR